MDADQQRTAIPTAIVLGIILLVLIELLAMWHQLN
jgi:hypothetical protein